jgi:hypothetical protein
MKRALLTLAAALVLLAGLDAWLRSARAAHRRDVAVLQPLIDPDRQVVPDRVRVVRLQVPGGPEWRYERRGDTWRFPAYHDAYVHGDRLRAFLDGVLGTLGTRATDDPADHDRMGVSEAQALQVRLEGSQGLLADVRLGRGLPGAAGPESYARLAGQDRVLHLHANPILVLGGALPPLLDPQLLPRDEPGSALTSLAVVTPDGEYVLQRVLAPMPVDAPPFPVPDAERYRWILQRGTRVDSCDDVSVRRWIGWVRSVRFDRLVAPGDPAYGLGEAGQLRLTDDQGRVDRLSVGRAAEAGAVYVSSEPAGLVSVMPAERAGWLLPTADLLLQPLPDPPPFESAP